MKTVNIRRVRVILDVETNLPLKDIERLSGPIAYTVGGGINDGFHRSIDDRRWWKLCKLRASVVADSPRPRRVKQ